MRTGVLELACHLEVARQPLDRRRPMQRSMGLIVGGHVATARAATRAPAGAGTPLHRCRTEDEPCSSSSALTLALPASRCSRMIVRTVASGWVERSRRLTAGPAFG